MGYEVYLDGFSSREDTSPGVYSISKEHFYNIPMDSVMERNA